MRIRGWILLSMVALLNWIPHIEVALKNIFKVTAEKCKLQHNKQFCCCRLGFVIQKTLDIVSTPFCWVKKEPVISVWQPRKESQSNQSYKNHVANGIVFNGMNQNGKVRHLFKWERKMGGSLTRGTFFQKWSKSIPLNCTLEVPRPVAHIQWPLFKWHNREVLLLSCSNLPFKWTYWSKNRAPRLKTTRLWRGPVIIVKQENVLYLWYGVPAHVRMHTPVTPPLH